jgi:hypothetical protein
MRGRQAQGLDKNHYFKFRRSGEAELADRDGNRARSGC